MNSRRPSGPLVANEPLFLLTTMWTLAPPGARLSHETAVRWYGLPSDRRQDGTPPHLTIPPGTNFDRKAYTIHVARLPPEDHAVFRGVAVTSPERTYLDVAGARDPERLLVVGDAFLAAGLTTREAIASRLERAGRVRGVVVARRITPLLDGRAQSPPESIVRYRLRAAGLPEPELQYAIPIGRAVVHADLAWPEARTVLEYEGRQHAEAGQFALDIERYSALAAHGWLVLRAGRNDLKDGSRQLIARVSQTLRLRGMG